MHRDRDRDHRADHERHDSAEPVTFEPATPRPARIRPYLPATVGIDTTRPTTAAAEPWPLPEARHA